MVIAYEYYWKISKAYFYSTVFFSLKSNFLVNLKQKNKIVLLETFLFEKTKISKTLLFLLNFKAKKENCI